MIGIYKRVGDYKAVRKYKLAITYEGVNMQSEYTAERNYSKLLSNKKSLQHSKRILNIK